MSALMDLLPPCYARSGEVCALQAAIEPELDALWILRDALQAQLLPASATWGLPFWETALGLETDTQRTAAARRAAITARLNPSGAATLEHIRELVRAQMGRECVILEDAAHCSFAVRVPMLQGEDGDGLSALGEQIRALRPAHLECTFSAIYPAEQGQHSLSAAFLRFRLRGQTEAEHCARVSRMSMRCGAEHTIRSAGTLTRTAPFYFGGAHTFAGEAYFYGGTVKEMI